MSTARRGSPLDRLKDVGKKNERTRPDELTKLSKAPKETPREVQSAQSFTPLTIREAREEINRPRSGPAKNATLYRAGTLSLETATEYITKAILYRRFPGESFENWRYHAPAVEQALSLCIHDLEPENCKVCNGYVKKLIERNV